MAIIQISKIINRSGNLVDLPQLDDAELGWATDAKLLYIGKSMPNENVEVLTSYSNISFSQIDGTVGNIDINPLNVANGQVLTFDGSDWVNRGGNAGGLITLGSVSNVQITGGATGYVLETDGLGSLSWTPKGALYTHITGLSNANPIVMTVANTTPYVNDLQVTITGANGASNNIVNGQTFYIQLASNFPTTGNVSLYTSAGGSGPVNGAGLTYTNSPNAIATSVLSSSSGGGGAGAGGSTGTVQFNNAGLLDGDATFTWNNSSKILTVTGNANVGNLNATGILTSTRYISNVTTGTAPLVVTSTTQVANLNVATSGTATTAGTVTTAAQPNITSVGTLTSLAVTGNANVGNLGTARILATGNITTPQFISNIATGTAPLVVTSTTQVANLNAATSGTATIATTAGTVTTAAQPNITSVGTLTSLGVNGTITAVNITANTGVFTGSGSGLSAIAGANVTGQVANALVAGTVYTAAQPNITSVGTLSSLSFANASTISGNNITLSTGSSSNTGTIVGNWSLGAGSKLQATYADLAEFYEADHEYEPGTVLEFSGTKEVTVATKETSRIAGVVTTNPAYVMNMNCLGPSTVAIALQGRTPCKVTGSGKKGEMLVSAGNGYAKVSKHPNIGTVVGKVLQDFDCDKTIIEIAVGRH